MLPCPKETIAISLVVFFCALLPSPRKEVVANTAWVESTIFFHFMDNSQHLAVVYSQHLAEMYS